MPGLGDECCTGSTTDAVAAGVEGDTGRLVQADDAGAVILLRACRLHAADCLGSCCCAWDQLLQGQLGNTHAVLHLHGIEHSSEANQMML